MDGSGAAESQRYHAYRCVAGHFMRNGDIIDEFVNELCIARLEQLDTRELFTSSEDDIDVDALNTRRVELEGRTGVIATLIARGQMTRRAAENALDEISTELRDIDQQMTKAIRINPLAELANVDDVRAWWESSTLARQRSMVQLLMTVKIKPVGNGRRITSLNACADTVVIDWLR